MASTASSTQNLGFLAASAETPNYPDVGRVLCGKPQQAPGNVFAHVTAAHASSSIPASSKWWDPHSLEPFRVADIGCTLY